MTVDEGTQLNNVFRYSHGEKIRRQFRHPLKLNVAGLLGKVEVSDAVTLENTTATTKTATATAAAGATTTTTETMSLPGLGQAPPPRNGRRNCISASTLGAPGGDANDAATCPLVSVSPAMTRQQFRPFGKSGSGAPLKDKKGKLHARIAGAMTKNMSSRTSDANRRRAKAKKVALVLCEQQKRQRRQRFFGTEGAHNSHTGHSTSTPTTPPVRMEEFFKWDDDSRCNNDYSGISDLRTNGYSLVDGGESGLRRRYRRRLRRHGDNVKATPLDYRRKTSDVVAQKMDHNGGVGRRHIGEHSKDLRQALLKQQYARSQAHSCEQRTKIEADIQHAKTINDWTGRAGAGAPRRDDKGAITTNHVLDREVHHPEFGCGAPRDKPVVAKTRYRRAIAAATKASTVTMTDVPPIKTALEPAVSLVT